MTFQRFTSTRMNGQYFFSIYHAIGSLPKGMRMELLINPFSVDKKSENQITDNNHGYHIRQKNDRLVEFFKFVLHFCQNDSNGYGCYCIYDNKYDIIKQGISRDYKGIVGCKEKFEVFKAHPVGAVNALPCIIIFKSQNKSWQRHIIVYEQIEKSRQSH